MRLRFQKRFYSAEVAVENVVDVTSELADLINIDCQVDLTYDLSMQLDEEGLQSMDYIPIKCEAVVTQWVDLTTVNTTQGLKFMNAGFERLEQDGDVLLIKRQQLPISDISFIHETSELAPQFVILNVEYSTAKFSL